MNKNPNIENLKYFKKGESGNPNGRAKGVKTRATILKKWIKVAAKITHPENDETIEGTMEDKVNLALLAKAIAGDVQAIKEINDTLYGKIPNLNELTGAGGKDLTTIINVTVDKSDTAETLKKLRSGG